MQKKHKSQEDQQISVNNFSWKHLNKILFSNKQLDGVFFMLGLAFLTVTMAFYIDDIFMVVKVLKTSYTLETFEEKKLAVRAIIIFALLAFYFGINAAFWLFLAFIPQYRLIIKQRELKILAVFCLNPLNFFMINYVVNNFADPQETFSSIIMTNEKFFDRKKVRKQAAIIAGCLFTMIVCFPLWLLCVLVISESSHAFLEESDIRSKIAVTSLVLFCILPPFSFFIIHANSKDPMFISWVSEYLVDEKKRSWKQIIWNWSLNMIVWILYFLSLLMVVISVGFSSIIYTFPFILEEYGMIMTIILYITTAFLVALTIVKKYYLDANKQYPIWLAILEILTLNPIIIVLAIVFLFKSNEPNKRGVKRIIKQKMDNVLIFPILINLVTIIICVIVRLVGFYTNYGFTPQFFFHSPVDIFIIVLTWISVIWLIINLSKTFSYITYLSNLKIWNIIDLCSFNFSGFFANTASEKIKIYLNKQLLWI